MSKKVVSQAERERQIKISMDYLEELFSGYPDFTRRFEKGRYEWVCPFPEKNLSIVVRSPIVVNAKGPYGLEVRRPLRFSVCLGIEGTNTTLRLAPSLMSSAGWMSIAREKINVLCDLIEDIGMCSESKMYYFPRYNIEIQANPAGTKHVMLTCPDKKCGMNHNTKFRKANRLKSRLHKWIIPGV